MHIPPVAFGGAAAMALSMGVARFAYTPILPAMHEQTGLSPADAGFLATLNFIGYTLATLWPLLARRLGHAPAPLTVVRYGLAACLGTTAAMAATDALHAWYVLRFIAGAASAVTMIYASTLVLDALARAGAAGRAGLGMHYAGVGLGITLSGLMVLLLEWLSVGWRGMWLGAAGMIALMIPVVLMTVSGSAPGPQAAQAPPGEAPAAPARSPVWLVGAYTCAGLGFIVSGTFLPLIAKQAPQTAPYAAFTWMLLGIAAIPSSALWARVAQRLGASACLVVQFALRAVGVLLPVFTQTPAALLASGVILGGTFMGIVTVAIPEARTLAPQRTAEMLALMTIGYSLAQIVGPPLAGVIATRTGSFDGGLCIAAGTLVLGVVFLLVDRRQALRARPA